MSRACSPDDAALTGLWLSVGLWFYKDDAPTALRIRAGSRLAKFLCAMLGEESQLAAIRLPRGKYKRPRPPGEKSFAEQMAEYKREEIALEEAKLARFWGGTSGWNPG